MKEIRVVGFSIENAVKENKIDSDKLANELGCEDYDLQKIFKGRKILTFPQLEMVAGFIGTKVDSFLNDQNDAYEQEVVHCMTGFTDYKNRETILDDIYDFMDLCDIVR